MGKMTEHGQFMGLKLRARTFDAGKLVVGVKACTRVSREMLAATENATGTERVIKQSRLFDDLRRRASITSSFERIVSLIIKADVQNGTQIQIKPEQTQDAGGGFTMTCYEGRIALIAQLLSIGWLAAKQSQAGDPSSLLIDGDNRLDVGEVSQVVNQPAELDGRFNVSSEENEPSRLEFSEECGGFGIEFLTRHTDQQELTSVVRWHIRLIGNHNLNELSK